MVIYSYFETLMSVIDALPNRELTKDEFDNLTSQNHRFHSVIGSPTGEVSGLLYDMKDGERSRIILWSPRDEVWVRHDTIPRDLDVDEQGKRIQEFISEHYPDDHVLNEEGKGFNQ